MEYGRKLKIMENEKHPLDDLKNDEVTEIVKNEKGTLQDLEYGEKTENHGNEKHPLDDLKNDEITEKREK